MAGQRAAVAYIAKKAQDLGAADADAAIAAMGAPAPEAAQEAAPEPTAAPEEGGEMLPEDAVAEVLLSQLQNGNLTEEDLGEIVMELAEENPEVAEELGLDLGVDAGEAPAEGTTAEEGDSAPVEEVEAEPTEGEKSAAAKKPAKAVKKSVKKASSKVEKRAELMKKVAAASKLLVKHLGK